MAVAILLVGFEALELLQGGNMSGPPALPASVFY
jgi:hypothetical protein